MAKIGISRRDVLRTLAVGATTGSVLTMIPAQAAEFAHNLVQKEKAATGKYAPKFFPAKQYETLVSLCDTIIPKDEKSGGAVEAGAPEFIDLITSENVEYQTQFGGGLMWLDNHCIDEFGKVYMECTPEQRKTTLDLIAYRKNAKARPELQQGIAFFAALRDMTCDGFYTSKIGIADLQYIGNTSRTEFPGCPPVPERQA
ncbi:MAG TPA: gluconate 2-dehydrogenase subunit 3 family protein [Candidatus Acidoferrum sp.]|nr:gluconate 2-dehydrogenase subunit 3 family protein [Candidatus Acidoferrum sp.]